LFCCVPEVYQSLCLYTSCANKNIVNNVQLYSSSISFLDDCGDHVVVINSKDIALPGDEWRQRVYFHHTGYPGGATWTLAWELHDKDPTMVRG